MRAKVLAGSLFLRFSQFENQFEKSIPKWLPKVVQNLNKWSLGGCRNNPICSIFDNTASCNWIPYSYVKNIGPQKHDWRMALWARPFGPWLFGRCPLGLSPLGPALWALVLWALHSGTHSFGPLQNNEKTNISTQFIYTYINIYSFMYITYIR